LEPLEQVAHQEVAQAVTPVLLLRSVLLLAVVLARLVAVEQLVPGQVEIYETILQ
jgi:hypothetical protein